MHFVERLLTAGCAFCLQPKFQIEYTLKVIGGSTGAIPGLGDMIEVVILTVDYMLLVLHTTWLDL